MYSKNTVATLVLYQTKRSIIPAKIYKILFFFRINNNTMFSIGLALCKMTKLEVQGFTRRKFLRAMSNREAEVMFWMTPELVEHLLSFLDPASILALAKTHPLTREVLQSGFNWTRFLKRSCPKQSFTLRPRFRRLLPPDNRQLKVSLMQHYAKKALEPIIEILLLIGKPESHLMQLLDLICENFPPCMIEFGNIVKVACPCQEVHDVSRFGLELLEMVESSTDTCLQQVDTIRMWSFHGPILSALKPVMLRRGGLRIKTMVDDFVFASQEDVEVFLTLAKISDSISFQWLVVLILIIFQILIIFHIAILIILSQGYKSLVPSVKRAGQCLRRLSD